jgi:hypothetical protein
MLLLISNMMFNEERKPYYPYIILSLVPIAALIYAFIRYFGAFYFFLGLYMCVGAIAYGLLMKRINT